LAVFLFSSLFFLRRTPKPRPIFFILSAKILLTTKPVLPHITISNGATTSVATFDVAQTAANLGVGDKISYGNAGATTTVYISAKQSPTVWNVITKTGTQPNATTTAAVLKISHAFSSLSAAVGGATPGASTASYLNTANLKTGNYVLNIPCYYDSGPDSTAVDINGWTTGASNYIKIYAPNNTLSEVNQSQRHSGKWNNSKYYLQANAYSSFKIEVGYVKIVGLQIDASLFSGGDFGIQYTTASVPLRAAISSTPQ
jgi:hypothetical protein